MNDDASVPTGLTDRQRETKAFLEVWGADLADEPSVSSPLQQVMNLEKDRVEGLITDAECAESVQKVVGGSLGSLPPR